MKITTTEITETRKSIAVTVPADIIRGEDEALTKTYLMKAKIPGFRPGKAPLKLVQSRYNKELIADLRQKVMAMAYDYIMKQNSGLNIYSIIDVKIVDDEISVEKDAAIIFTVDVKPEINLPEYKGIAVVIPEVGVAEKDLEKAIEHTREQQAEYKKVEEAANKGDYVKLSYEGRIGGQLISEILPGKPIYGTQKSTWEEAGAEDVPGVTAVIEGIIGMKAGDEATFKMTYAPDHEVPELAGKEATYSVVVEEVRQKILPELNEAFFKSIEVESLEKLRENLKEEFLRRRKHESDVEAKDQIINYLMSHASFEAPESAVEDEVIDIMRTFMTRMMRMGMTMKQLEDGKDKFLEQAQKLAKNQAKINVILDAIAKKEGIEAKPDDFSKQIMHEAMIAEMQPDQYVNVLKKDQHLIDRMKFKTICEKVLDFLYKECKVEYRKGTEKGE